MSDIYRRRLYRRFGRQSKLFKYLKSRVELTIPPSDYCQLNEIFRRDMSDFQEELEKCGYCCSGQPSENPELSLVKQKGLYYVNVFNSLIALAEQDELDVEFMQMLQQMLRAKQPAENITSEDAN